VEKIASWNPGAQAPRVHTPKFGNSYPPWVAKEKIAPGGNRGDLKRSGSHSAIKEYLLGSDAARPAERALSGRVRHSQARNTWRNSLRDFARSVRLFRGVTRHA
jgi:hypothetical protein